MKIFFERAWQIFARTVEAIEESPAPLWYFGFTFLAVITLRTFLEFFEGDHNPASIAYLFLQVITTQPQLSTGYIVIHFLLFYLSLALTLLLVLRYTTKQPLDRLFKLITTGFSITVIVPIIDLIVSGGVGYSLTYVSLEGVTDLLFKFFTIFGFHYIYGISPGIQVELALVILFAFAYARLKKSSVVWSISISLAVYTTIFIYLILPSIEQFVFLHFFPYASHTNSSLIEDFVFLSGIMLVCFLAFERKKLFIALLRDIRLPRLMHYWLMFGLGVLFVERAGAALPFTFATLQQILLLLASTASAWVYSVITNNLEDVEIDRISNVSRPLLSDAVSTSEYKNISWFFLAAALCTAAAVSFSSFFLIILFLGNYFIYSMPPLRLKRVFLLSKVIIMINSCMIFLLGIQIFNKLPGVDMGMTIFHLVAHLPALPIFSLPLFILMALNFLDLKDYRGDKEAGIATLPVLIGMRKAQILCGIVILCAYIATGLLFNNWMILVMAIAIGLIEFLLVTKKTYRELPVFIPYLASLIALFFILS